MSTIVTSQGIDLKERIRATVKPIDLISPSQKVEKLIEQAGNAIALFQSRKEKLAKDRNLSGEGRLRLLTEAKQEAITIINTAADDIQKIVDDVQTTLAEPQTVSKVSDVLLADASTRLNSMTRQNKYLSERTFIQFYENAVEDGDLALSELLRVNFRSIVRQYTGKAALNPEAITVLSMSEEERLKFERTLDAMDVATLIRQKALYLN